VAVILSGTLVEPLKTPPRLTLWTKIARLYLIQEQHYFRNQVRVTMALNKEYTLLCLENPLLGT
jgi:hypothetical protein